MKFHLTLLFTLFGLCSLAQNYQTVRSSDVKYMMAEDTTSDYDHILGIACDSAEYVNNDSILYLFKTLRHNQNDTTQNFSCPEHMAGCWLGEKVIVKPDGINIFFNEELDSIFICTLDTLGQTSFMYQYLSGDSVFATVTDISEESFLGYTDSVKTYTITTTYPYFWINPAEFKISKNYGFVSAVPMYNFPSPYQNYTAGDIYHLVGQDNPTIGITKPTNYDIHNLEVGDIIQYKTGNYSGGPSTTIYFHKTVLSKQVNGNSVEYEMKLEEQHNYSGYINDPPTVTYYSDTVTEYYSIDMQYNTPYHPGSSWVDYQNGGAAYTLDVKYSSLCGYITEFSTHSDAVTQQENCFDGWHIPSTSYSEISGANNYYSSFWDVQTNTSYGKYLVYKSNSGVECGDIFFVGIEDPLPIELDIYPNPTNGMIQINSTENWQSYRLLSLTGEIVQSGQKSSQIDISSQTTGIYLLELQFGDQTIRQRVIKH